MFNVLSAITFIIFFSLAAQAKFDLFLTKKLNMPENYQDQNALVTVSNKAANSLSVTDSSGTVVSKIVDSSLMYWWDNSGIKNTRMGQAVETVQNKMRIDANLGSTGSDKNHNAVQHKVSLKLLAAQAIAKIEYLGWFRGSINYDTKTSTAEAEIYENLNNNKDLVVTHSVASQESKSQVSLRWNW